MPVVASRFREVAGGAAAAHPPLSGGGGGAIRMKPPFPWSGGGLLAQAGSEQLRHPPPPGRRGGTSVLRGSSVAAAVQRRARGVSRLPSPCGGSAGCLRRGEILIVGARPTMGRARSASDLFKMLNPNTCVFRDFGRRGSQSQGKAKNADCCI